VGWLEANHFTRVFRQKFGLPPSKYRGRLARVRNQSLANAQFAIGHDAFEPRKEQVIAPPS
jgi:AraC-like DNA-binding protein